MSKFCVEPVERDTRLDEMLHANVRKIMAWERSLPPLPPTHYYVVTSECVDNVIKYTATPTEVGDVD